MPTPPRIETAIEVSPFTVLVRGVLEWACPAVLLRGTLRKECRPRQWNRKLTISAIAWLMLAVVSGVRRSVFSAFQADRRAEKPTIIATATALYAKYGRIDPRYTVAIVRESGRRMRRLLTSAGDQGSRSAGRAIGSSSSMAPTWRGPNTASSRAAGSRPPGCRGGSWRPTSWPPAWWSTPRPARTPTPPSGCWSGTSWRRRRT